MAYSPIWTSSSQLESFHWIYSLWNSAPQALSRSLLTHFLLIPIRVPGVSVSLGVLLRWIVKPLDLFLCGYISPQSITFLHTYICIMRSLRDQNSSLCYYLSPFYPVETKILTFTSPARMTLNRGICKTPILALRSLMAHIISYHGLKDHCMP